MSTPTTTTNPNPASPSPALPTTCARCGWFLESLTVHGIPIHHCFHCGIDYYAHTPALTAAELNADPPKPTTPGPNGNRNRKGKASHHNGRIRSSTWGSPARVQAWARKYRDVIEMAITGYPNAEIARELDMSPSAVSKIVVKWRDYKEMGML